MIIIQKQHILLLYLQRQCQAQKAGIMILPVVFTFGSAQSCSKRRGQ